MEYKKQLAKTENIEHDLKTIYRIYQRRSFWLKLIYEIQKLKNEEIWITGFENVANFEMERSDSESKIGAVSARPGSSLFGEGDNIKPYLIIKGETSAEYQAISEFEAGLKSIPLVDGGSVRILYARSPVDGIRSFAIGLRLNYE